MLMINYDIVFEPGHNYWILTEDEYETLSELMDLFEGDSFLGDFHHQNGAYYAEASDIDSEEADFLGEWAIGTFDLYRKSTKGSDWI